MLTLIASAVLTCTTPVAIDGDTIRCGPDQPNVRIWGVQAPEKGMAGWAESRDSLQRFVNGGVVCEPKGTSYRRVVGRCFNRMLFDVGFFQMKEGHATEWCRYSRGFYRTCR